jgi:hypothetical protein
MTNNGQTDTAVQDQQYPARPRCMSTLSASSRSPPTPYITCRSLPSRQASATKQKKS